MWAIKVARLPLAARSWLDTAAQEIGRSPDKIVELFPGAARGVGGSGDAIMLAREKLFTVLLAATGDEAAGALAEKLYRWGDTDERLAVLRGLEVAALRGELGPTTTATGVGLAEDALRCNDPRLVTAALAGFGTRFLSQHAWRDGVMKLVFMGVPLREVPGLPTRVDAELARMATDYISERRAAGRSVPADVERLLTANTTEAPT
jgi:hypothetical protein